MEQTWGNCLMKPFIYEEINPSTPALQADLEEYGTLNQKHYLIYLLHPMPTSQVMKF